MIYNTYVQLLGMMDINGPIIDNIEQNFPNENPS